MVIDHCTYNDYSKHGGPGATGWCGDLVRPQCGAVGSDQWCGEAE